MPKFNPPPRKRKGDDDDDKNELVIPDSWTEPRCHVCMSKHRRAIEKLVAYGASPTEISRMLGGEIDRRSISNHAESHLNYEAAAVRTIIQDEMARAEADIEAGVKGAVARRVYLQTALHKAHMALVDDDVTVEPKDAIQIIAALEKMDQMSGGAEIDEIRLQFNAFVQAIRDVSARRNMPELGNEIFERARQIVDGVSQIRDTPQLES